MGASAYMPLNKRFATTVQRCKTGKRTAMQSGSTGSRSRGMGGDLRGRRSKSSAFVVSCAVVLLS